MLVRLSITLTLFVYSFPGIGQATKIQKSNLVNCWIDSREENIKNSGTNIYRPCNFKTFPAARFRFKVELNGDGSCNYLYLASNDAHYMTSGTWNFNEENKLLEIMDLKGILIRNFRILNLQKEFMEIAGE